MTDGVGRYSSAISSQILAMPSMTLRILAAERSLVASRPAARGPSAAAAGRPRSRSGRRNSAPNQTWGFPSSRRVRGLDPRHRPGGNSLEFDQSLDELVVPAQVITALAGPASRVGQIERPPADDGRAALPKVGPPFLSRVRAKDRDTEVPGDSPVRPRGAQKCHGGVLVAPGPADLLVPPVDRLRDAGMEDAADVLVVDAEPERRGGDDQVIPAGAVSIASQAGQRVPALVRPGLAGDLR